MASLTSALNSSYSPSPPPPQIGLFQRRRTNDQMLRTTSAGLENLRSRISSEISSGINDGAESRRPIFTTNDGMLTFFSLMK